MFQKLSTTAVILFLLLLLGLALSLNSAYFSNTEPPQQNQSEAAPLSFNVFENSIQG